jgi:hypothetical protein
MARHDQEWAVGYACKLTCHAATPRFLFRPGKSILLVSLESVGLPSWIGGASFAAREINSCRVQAELQRVLGDPSHQDVEGLWIDIATANP